MIMMGVNPPYSACSCAILALHKFGDDFLFVSNIAFAGRREWGTDCNLTPDQGEKVLMDFHDNVLSNVRTDTCGGFPYCHLALRPSGHTRILPF
jgi:hypothetical protein